MSRALVISGGGSKGAFAVGVIKRLVAHYPSLKFDMFVGTSTGSLIVPLVAMNELGLLEEIYTTKTTRDIVLQNRIGDRVNETSIFDANPLWEVINESYTNARYDNLLQTGKKLFITSTCLQTGELVVFTTYNAPKPAKHYQVRSLADAAHFRRAVMASACQPVFMQPIKVNRDIPSEPHPNFQFVDGGVREYAGVEIAIDNGATEIFTILLSPEEETTADVPYTDLFNILQRTIGIFSEDVSKNDLIIPEQYNQALKYIDSVKQKMRHAGLSDGDINTYFNIAEPENPYINKLPIKFFKFQPAAPLGGGPGGLTFDPAEMKGMVLKGEATAMDFINTIDSADITW